MKINELDLLEGLLRCYSPSGEEAKAVAFLTGEMQKAGFTAAADGAGNAVGRLGDGPQEIVLLGHIDTVPGEIEVAWDGDDLYGRGAVDAKGPLACFTAAAARVGARPGWKITVIGAVGEEGDSPGARYVVDKYQPQYAIIGEPSGWSDITLGYKGAAWITYTIKKAMAHTAAKGENACENAVRFWNEIQQISARLNTGKERVFDQLSPSLRKMESGSDDFSETARLEIGFRLPPGLSPEDLMNRLAEINPGGVVLPEGHGVSAYRAEKNSPLVRAFLGAIRSAGGKPGFSLKTGTADMNLVGPVWNCPSAAYGPGDSTLDHTPNEHIAISEYLKGIQVVEKALLALTA